MNSGYREEVNLLTKYETYIMQLCRALNRQYSKEAAINVVVNFIYRKIGFRAMYIDAIEENKTLIVNRASKGFQAIHEEKYFDIKENYGVFNSKLPIPEYKKTLFFEDKIDINTAFPMLNEKINAGSLLSTPVFSQSKLVGLLIIYSPENSTKIPLELQGLAKLVTRELTAVFSRIERQNLEFENMLGLTALENILLYSNEDSTEGEIDPLDKIVHIISRTTGMKKCTLALLDENEEFLLPHFSTFNKRDHVKDIKYPIDRTKTKDHTAIIAIETKKPVIVHDALSDPRCDPLLAMELGIYSNITLPILNVYGKAIGVMYLDNGQYETYSERQVRFLEIIARHIGLIVSNMEYIGDLKLWSKYDGLTGLLNRRAFESIYEEIYKIYRYSEDKFSILMIDIDNFKSTNDQYGHQMGDKVLKNVAKCVCENVRSKDVIARYGGEEIIVILKDIGKERGKDIAERIRLSIENLSVDGIKVTVSIGIATFGVDSYNKDNLIYLADKCLYEAKSIGKNQVNYI
ncbi:sensor domain-containing diguanylate cyclase [Alkaliphilus oremlandii]|uniref:Diguanylate cyclase with GAF sensor n=1 Tax=Alkaliphilus oremlandii (strain OhILAs) TaxID=350688 RepID=A8MIQ8_ALKOO|nr:sensor domain-containing diguanylate cyclase [Alkaliphilus oremlandii]ABW19690.1 diguanylate cyclase with GAF sensor [Alkaliphilus oremlandii OhILAs]